MSGIAMSGQAKRTALVLGASAVVIGMLMAGAGEALAQAAQSYTQDISAGTGQPIQRQMTLQNPVTPVAADINWFHSWVNKVIIAIAAFVLVLMIYVMFRFNEKANPTPSRTTHNAVLEVAWTVIPILILVVIAIPSFRLLYLQYSFPKPDLTIKAIGNAWFWEHEYPDLKNAQGQPRPIKVTSNMIKDEDLLKVKLGEAAYNQKFGGMSEINRLKAVYTESLPLWTDGLVRQLSVDNAIAVPVGKVVHMLITSNDVIHSWTIPSFGSKMQAVPGRVTATWFRADKVGMYYGQCSVLCGKEHSSMPIAVAVVSDKDYAAWVEAAQARDWRRARTILQAATK